MPLAPGFPTVGIVGAGQLARMSAAPAAALGVRLRLLASVADESAAQVVPDVVLGSPSDVEALLRFAEGCDVVTFEHEHVPPASLRALVDAGVAVRPGPEALLHAQDKAVMRERLSAAGLPCPRWAVVTSTAEVEAFADGAWPVVLKAARGGYDGRGVWVVGAVEEAGPVLAGLAEQGVACLAEERVDFTRELSAQVARSPSGQAAAYPVVQTVQRGGICREVVAPAPGLSEDAAVAAQDIALRIAGLLGVVGMLAVELFETADGRVLVNELAMRPHNSGHWTIEGAVTSQFEQHLRAVLDLPLGSPARLAPLAVMCNVLGGDHPDMYEPYRHVLARDPGLHVHMYGKEVRAGRKVGHVTALGADLDDLLDRTRHASAYFMGEVLE
ncbi:5-(carboxyamino)imidazole ribonucleotide synthase [Motilibacter rhizosphaerae]|uniref:N5-carboxyaminoimidazole ribonucleotide synthase n=1 Tax=Motilibacter rhizosphaerae TaxID=598652 RepID=A0A4Q7NUY3_9ACTN|nr:5-(carboxyamino)imidazole ribonucleotide synthase [Motilibacter rhizosphaerae]RZS90232.1 5-(carboxyamino)imidazole ribonucleotide synthase [Motilibacter rhizosphaerae]